MLLLRKRTLRNILVSTVAEPFNVQTKTFSGESFLILNDNREHLILTLLLVVMCLTIDVCVISLVLRMRKNFIFARE